MKTKTQKERILTWLKAGNTLTPLQAVHKFGSLRLGGIIHYLRKFEGWPIKTEMIKIRKGTWVARYSL